MTTDRDLTAGVYTTVTVDATTVKVDVNNAAVIAAGGLPEHLADVVAAHAASAVSFNPTGTIAATDMQAAIAEVATDAAAAYQPLDADLTAIAALTTTAVGRSVLAAADAAAIRVITGSVPGLRIEDEGVSTVAVATAINFVGAGVTVTDGGSSEATVTISSGGGGISGIVVKDEGTSTVAVGTALNFIGANVTVTDATLGQANVTLTGATTAQGATADTAVQPARSISTTAPLTGGGDLSANRTLAVSAASDTAAGVVELATPTEAVAGASGTLATTPAGVKAAIDKQPEFLPIAVGDNTTALTVGTTKESFRMPFGATLTGVRASLITASSSGIPTINIKEAGVTIFSTKLTIDATELTSTTAAVAAVVSDAALADDALITIDIDVAGTGAAGLKIIFYWTRA